MKVRVEKDCEETLVTFFAKFFAEMIIDEQEKAVAEASERKKAQENKEVEK